jgi:hypothetical protein
MKILKIILVISLITMITASTTWANGGSYRAKGHSITLRNTYYPHTFRPVTEYIEDGVALVLDLPLALMSPILCPVVGPIMDAIDPVENRSYPGRRRPK